MEEGVVRRTRGVVRTGDLAVAKRALARTHELLSLDVAEDGAPFRFEETVVASERLSLESTSSNGTVAGTVRTGPQVVVTWLKSGRGVIGEHRAPIGRPILFHQEAEPFRWISFQQDTLRIDRDVVHKVAAERGGWAPQPLEFKPYHVPEGATLAAWWLTIRTVASGMLQGPAEVTAERDTLENFVVNPGSSKLYGDVLVNGKVAASDAYLFELWGGSLKPLQLEGDNAILTGTTVHISQDAANLLNKTFSTDAVKRGMLVGTATITAKIK